MRLAPIILATCGIGLAGGCAILAQQILNPPQVAAPAPQVQAEQTVVIIAAKRQIGFGKIIRRDDLYGQTWPADLVPEGAYTSSAVLLGPEGTAPRRATQTIRAGDALVTNNVSDFGATVTIGSTLAPGTRAVAIRVNAETAVGGFVTPGDRVDIVLTEGRGETLRTGVILQDVRVLAVDQDTEARGARNARTMTVEVTTLDSQRLVLAQEAGQLSLILRNEDVTQGESKPSQITMNDVWGIAKPTPKPRVEVERVDPTTIRVRRGMAAQDYVVENE